jgi:hypothetical protein
MNTSQLVHCCSVAYISNVEWQFETAKAMYDAVWKTLDKGFGPNLIAVQHPGAREIPWMKAMGFKVVGRTGGGGSILLLSAGKLKDPAQAKPKKKKS